MIPANAQYLMWNATVEITIPSARFLHLHPSFATCVHPSGLLWPLKAKKMSNYAVWNTRLRHEWLAKPAKGKYLSRRKRARCGLEEALVRKAEEAAGTGNQGEKSAADA